MKKFFPMSSLNLPWHNPRLCSLVLSLVAWKNLAGFLEVRGSILETALEVEPHQCGVWRELLVFQTPKPSVSVLIWNFTYVSLTEGRVK